jgi:hypothetical protein
MKSFVVTADTSLIACPVCSSRGATCNSSESISEEAKLTGAPLDSLYSFGARLEGRRIIHDPITRTTVKIPLLFVLAIVLGLMTPVASWDPVPAHAQAQDPADLQRIRNAVQGKGRARVIVELRLPAGQHVPEGLLGSQAAVTLQRQDIATTAAHVISRVLPTGARMIHRYNSLPFIALEVDSAGLAQLQASGLYLTRIMQDRPLYPRLFQSGPLVEAPGAWTAGFDGTGWAVAIRRLMLTATVLPTSSNNISGVFTYEVRENSVLTRSGNGTVAGTAISNQLTLTVDAQDSALESCHTTGTITATK